MSFLPRFPGSIGGHALSAAANARDGLRAARYFVQELSIADETGAAAGENKHRPPAWLLPADAPAGLITGFIAQNARIADKVMHWSSDAAASLLAPDWRVLPSPFDPDTMRSITASIRGESLSAQAVFNAYFYRAALRILRRFSKPPFLVLEHRIDAARRSAAAGARPGAPDAELVAEMLNALVRAAPVVEAGAIARTSALAGAKDLNVAIAAVAGAALLFGQEGRPEAIDEEQFFAIAAALVAPRLATIERLILAGEVAGLAAELVRLKQIY